MNNYSIPFVGLKLGQHQFEFDVDDKFFELFEYSVIEKGNFHVHLMMEKQTTMLLLDFNISGTLHTHCDRCGGALEVPVDGTQPLIVKFGADEYQSSDEILVIPPSEYEVNVGPFIYEFITLLLPYKHLHGEGECNKAAVKLLEQLSSNDDDEDTTDPRWDALKKLK